jgi:hypothetical protein
MTEDDLKKIEAAAEAVEGTPEAARLMTAVRGLVEEARRLRLNAAFALQPHHRDRLRAWADEQDKVVAARQKLDPAFDRFAEMGLLPYYGACGGALTYSFTPTSLGTSIQVTHHGTKASIHLTADDDW